MTEEVSTDSATDLKVLRDAFRSSLAHAVLNLMPDYLSKLETDGDLEDKRKFIAQAADQLGWKEAPPKDPTANLPVAHIQINIMGAEQTQPTVVDVVATQLPEPPEGLMQLISDVDINDDLLLDD